MPRKNVKTFGLARTTGPQGYYVVSAGEPTKIGTKWTDLRCDGIALPIDADDMRSFFVVALRRGTKAEFRMERVVRERGKFARRKRKAGR